LLKWSIQNFSGGQLTHLGLCKLKKVLRQLMINPPGAQAADYTPTGSTDSFKFVFDHKRRI